MGAYASFDAAARRVEALKAAGRWPGIVRHPDGTCDLKYDPEAVSRL